MYWFCLAEISRLKSQYRVCMKEQLTSQVHSFLGLVSSIRCYVVRSRLRAQRFGLKGPPPCCVCSCVTGELKSNFEVVEVVFEEILFEL
eukprot:6300664-Amphidinium_carterae.2